MRKTFYFSLLLGGLALMLFGLSTAEPLGSSISGFLANSPTDKAVWLLAIGIVFCVVGQIGLMRKSGVTS